MGRDGISLRVEQLCKSYKGRMVVDKLSLEINPGEVVGLLGPNGAGKTTTFHMIMGLVRADSGRVLLGHKELNRWPMYKRARAGLGFLSQYPSVFRSLTVEQNLLLYLQSAGIKGREAKAMAQDVLAEYELDSLSDSLASTLSGGERRRLEIARAMIQDPVFVLLDEPFSGVDPIAVEEIRSQIRRLVESGIGLLITDHNVRETLSTCDRAYIVKDGLIIGQGSPTDLASDERARSSYLGENFRLEEGL